MYSPPVGGAARRPIATIDKPQTSNRRLIIFGEEDYLCGARTSQVVGRDRRACPRVLMANNAPRGRAGSKPFPTNLDPLLRVRGHPRSAAFESARAYRCERALRPGAGANYSSTPSQIRIPPRS